MEGGSCGQRPEFLAWRVVEKVVEMDHGDHHTSDAGPTIGEVVASGLGIQAECRCGHGRTIDPRHVCASPGIDATDLGSILRCSVCGARGLATWVAPLVRAQ